MNKDTIRESILRQRDRFSASDCKQRSSLLLTKLFEREEYVGASELYTYVSFGTEVDTIPLILEALRSGKKVCVPKVLQKGCMEFYQIHTLSNLVPGKFGIPEPDLNQKEVQPAPLGDAVNPLVIMPGVAFDSKGHRIGYGGGYYDRYLSQEGLRKQKKIALCYECQLMPIIDTEEFDIPVDVLITEENSYECTKDM